LTWDESDDFPDPTLARILVLAEPAGTSDAQTNQDRNAIGSVWVADARFTLDQLTKLNSDDKLLKT
jgi:hypothetical protein